MNWQFCTLEQALALKELGVTQTSLFYWNKPKSGSHGEYIAYGWSSNAIASAFNASELLELLGPGVYHFGEMNQAEDLAGDLLHDIGSGIQTVARVNDGLSRRTREKSLEPSR